LSIGCAAQPKAPPQIPAKQAQKDPPQRENGPLPHLAPPPAYGNKVVLADAVSSDVSDAPRL
jgi:hypothetical protein